MEALDLSDSACESVTGFGYILLSAFGSASSREFGPSRVRQACKVRQFPMVMFMGCSGIQHGILPI